MRFKKVLKQSSESFFSKDKKKKKIKITNWWSGVSGGSSIIPKSPIVPRSWVKSTRWYFSCQQLFQVEQAAQVRRLASTRSMHPPSKGIPICQPSSGPPVTFMELSACHRSLGPDGCAWAGDMKPPYPTDTSTDPWLGHGSAGLRPPPTPWVASGVYSLVCLASLILAIF